MNVALVSGTPHMPQVFGGVEVNTHTLAGELQRRGNSVCVLAKLSLRNRFGLWRAAQGAASGRRIWIDQDLGYPVFRTRRPAEHAIALPRPTVAVIQNGAMLDLAVSFARIGVPPVAYLHNVGFESWPTPSADLPFHGYIANSHFTASRFEQRFGLVPAVIPPLFRRADYVTDAGGSLVTFINPVATKGVDLAIEIARLCPKIRFAFIRGWPLNLREEARLKRSAARLGNIELRDRTRDMRTVYRDTRILLVPSQEDETWGRVVTEAQFSGIPALVSDRGGLPEAVGPGGSVIPYDAPAHVWADRLAALWSDRQAYSELSNHARAHADRPDLDPDAQVSRFIDTLHSVVGVVS
jgi:glycosyltransferase involved in cell wall biosynthesis